VIFSFLFFLRGYKEYGKIQKLLLGARCRKDSMFYNPENFDRITPYSGVFNKILILGD